MSTLRQRTTDKVAEATGKAAAKVDVDELQLPEESKFVVPNFTNKQLMDAIPAHCFERSALKSTQYLVQDVVALAILVVGAFHIEDLLNYLELAPLPTKALRIALWTTYTVVAGFFGTGLWVVGHECGHQAYSTSKTINNTVGWFVHSFLLVPYHAWRISHGRHHASTGSLTRDEVFVPRTRSEIGLPAPKDENEVVGIHVSEESQSLIAEVLEHVPMVAFWIAVYQTLGFPLYLIMNAAGQKRYPGWTNHFSPSSIIFRKNHKWQILWSDLGFFLTIGAMAYWSYARSFTEMFLIYGIPYLWVNNWIILITYLQHTDPNLPHYSDKTWTFPRGALATIDRTFLGPIGMWCVHGLCETHVAHHISSKIPHYHGEEATAALKEFLGQHYHRSEENMLVSLWKNHNSCRFIEDDVDIAFYKNARGEAKRYGVEEPPVDSGVELSS
ncbi:hypothetical protein Q8F55_005073 [Vanrija albida]|uniref:Fatty acid desaturase domain-containing protein n=1 Tax=Vanrija albida TaxID=181172 RepID=A0ABR3Q0Y0_9TREE